jgi:hypothetical protein
MAGRQTTSGAWCRRPVIPRTSSCSTKAWQRTPSLRHGRKKISLLRLDTDLYSSTYHKLVHLYPLLAVGSILIIDDYGAFQGAGLATDRFIEENPLAVFLSRYRRIGSARHQAAMVTPPWRSSGNIA